MEGKEDYVLGKRQGIRLRFRQERPDNRAFCGHELLEKQLADEALPHRRTGREMSVMGKMLGAIRAEDILQRVQVVMVERRDEHHLQDDRQQPGGKYASFQGQRGGKDTK